jgi:hypothetical protein
MSLARGNSIDKGRLFERGGELGARFQEAAREIGVGCGGLQGQGGEMDDAIDEVIFRERRAAGIAAENFQGGEESCVGGEDGAGGKNLQAHLPGAAGHGAVVIFVGFGERDDGDNVADADIDHHAELVEDPGNGRTEGDQVEDLAFADELAAAVVGILAMNAEGGGLALGA